MRSRYNVPELGKSFSQDQRAVVPVLGLRNRAHDDAISLTSSNASRV